MAVIVAVLACVALIAGASFIYWPAGLIVAGVVGLCAAYVIRFFEAQGGSE